MQQPLTLASALTEEPKKHHELMPGYLSILQGIAGSGSLLVGFSD
jgi:hypothetical protein